MHGHGVIQLANLDKTSFPEWNITMQAYAYLL